MADGSVTIDTSLNNKGFEKGLNKLGSIAKTGLKGLAVGVGAVATAFTGVVIASTKARGEIEQSIGGVETLFKDSADKVIENANKAYKTAGLSANQYMQNVTSFSASLLQSCANDTNKAADIADMAMIDMSDNANKMGTDMASIQNAYQGFAKQNYTMLDNLKLGYGGTKEEMERLLAHATKLTGVKYNISNLKDVYEAIHVVQEELGITGTTALEAEKTLTGSIASLKASWENFLSGSGSLGDVVDSVSIAVKNIIRIVSDAMPDIVENIVDWLPDIIDLGSKLIQSLIQGIIEYLPNLMSQAGDIVGNLIEGIVSLIPELIPVAKQVLEMFINGLVLYLPQIIEEAEAIINVLIDGIIQTLPLLIPATLQIIETLVTGLIEYLPKILEMGVNIITQLISGIAKMIPTLIPQAVECILTIVESLIDNLDKIIDAGIELIFALIDGIIDALPILIEKMPEIIDKLITKIIENLPKILKAGADLLLKLIDGIVNTIPTLIEKIPIIINNIVNTLADNLPQIVEEGMEILLSLVLGIIDALPHLIQMGPTLIMNLVGSIISNLPKILATGIKILGEISYGIIKAIPDLLAKIPQVISSIAEGFGNAYDKLWNIGSNMIKGLWNGIKSVKDWLFNKIKSFKNDVLNKFKSFFGIHSPSTLFRDEIGKYLAFGLGEGFEDNIAKAYKDMQSAVDYETSKLGGSLTASSMINVERTDNLSATLKNIENDKEITVNTITNLDGKVLTQTVNKVNARQRLAYGLA